jgi:hypothetical protein
VGLFEPNWSLLLIERISAALFPHKRSRRRKKSKRNDRTKRKKEIPSVDGVEGRDESAETEEGRGILEGVGTDVAFEESEEDEGVEAEEFAVARDGSERKVLDSCVTNSPILVKNNWARLGLSM